MPSFGVADFLLGSTRRRRLVSVPSVTAAAATLATTAPLWAPTALAVDLVRDPRRLPRVRAVSMAAAWATLESIGIAASSALWVTGRADDADANYVLQRWWANRLLDATRLFAGIRLEIDGEDPIAPGPVVLAPRHTSIADTLIPIWLLARHDMRPRYVLKRELLVDPCLDIVGNRIPNHFVVRDGDASREELRALTTMARGMGPHDAAVIYPEGAVGSAARRVRALERIAEAAPERARRLASLTRSMPPRVAGLRAVLDGCPDADIVFVDHQGLEPLGAVANAPRTIPLTEPVRIRLRRVRRRDMPDDHTSFAAWLDERWLELDAGTLDSDPSAGT